MIKTSVCVFAILLSAGTLGASVTRDVGDKTTTFNGWFSDKGCAETKVKSDEVTPNGTICVKKCLDEGATAVFVDPKGRAMYDVKDHPSVKDDVGFYLELSGVVDEKAKTISVRSVKRLGEVVQMCALQRKKN